MSDEQPTRILVVDDVVRNCQLLKRRLDRLGFDAATASNGPDALLALKARTFDAVLLDLRMPGMDGVEVLEKIRETWSKAELPVIMVTGELGSEEVVRALNAGANDYVTKPINVPVMMARMKAHLDIQKEVRSKESHPEVVVAPGGTLIAGFVLDGRYEVVRQIARGGFATVYEAEQLSTKRRVAVKLLDLARLYDAKTATQEIARFEQEMHLIGKIQHPNLVQLIDSGSLRIARQGSDSPVDREAAEGPGPDELAVTLPRAPEPLEMAPYIVMELLQGETLRSCLGRETSLSANATVDIMLPVISAVAAAHAQGVIHRDIKPPNIFLHRPPDDGPIEPRVLDFGIAKLVGPEALDLTMTSSPVGTPHYMSPEQVKSHGAVQAYTDQFSLGVVTYECLTGRRPCVADSMIKVLHMIATGDWKPPRHHKPEVPAELESLVMRMMAIEPEERFSSLEELGEALLPWASDEARARWKGTNT